MKKILLALLLVAQTAHATDFVRDGTSLPGTKVDARPLSGPANQNLTAAEFNTLRSAVADLRDAILEFTIDVRNYGCKGDGVTDDTVCVQAAVAAAVRAYDTDSVGANEAFGSVVYFPHGVYLVTDTITVNTKGGVWFVGEGNFNSQIKCDIGASSACVEYAGAGSGPDPLFKGGGFKDISIACDSDNDGCQDGIHVSYGQGFYAIGLKVRSAGRNGLRVTDTVDVSIIQSKFEDNEEAGLYAGTNGTLTTLRAYSSYFTGTRTGANLSWGGFALECYSCVSEASGYPDPNGDGYEIRAGTASFYSPYMEANTGDQFVVGSEGSATVLIDNPYFNPNHQEDTTKYGLRITNGTVTVNGGNWDVFTASKRTIYIATNQRLFGHGYPADAKDPVLQSGASFSTYTHGTLERVGALGQGQIQAATFTGTGTSTTPAFQASQNDARWYVGNGGNAFFSTSDADVISFNGRISINTGTNPGGNPIFDWYASGVQKGYIHPTGNIAHPGSYDLSGEPRLAFPISGGSTYRAMNGASGNAHIFDTGTTMTSGNLMVLDNNGSAKFNVDYTGIPVSTAGAIGFGGAATGKTVNYNGQIKRYNYSVTFDKAFFKDNAAAKDFVIATIPAKGRLVAINYVITQAFAAPSLSDYDLTISTQANSAGTLFIYNNGLDSIANHLDNFGDPSMIATGWADYANGGAVTMAAGATFSASATQDLHAYLTTTGTNMGNGTVTNFTAGSITFYVTYELM